LFYRAAKSTPNNTFLAAHRRMTIFINDNIYMYGYK
jgi:hypothetical protein